jgi:hypothetical protein
MVKCGGFFKLLNRLVWRLLEQRSSEYNLGRLEKVTGCIVVREQELRSRDQIEVELRMGKSEEERETKLFPCRDTYCSTGLEENIFRSNDFNLLYDKSISLIIRSPAKAFISISSTLLYDSIRIDRLE